MKFSEKKADLFTLGSDYILAHCISADYALGAGIAKIFEEKYGVKTSLLAKYTKNVWDGSGRCEFTAGGTAEDGTGSRTVANLITKEKYYYKPTYKTLRQALEDMRNKLPAYGAKKIGMPLIGCGLDKLKWEKVLEMIKEVFADTDYEILVCYL